MDYVACNLALSGDELCLAVLRGGQGSGTALKTLAASVLRLVGDKNPDIRR
jgi:hypothetical protein